MKSCLSVIGGIVVVIFIIGACASGLNSTSSPSHNSYTSTSSDSSSRASSGNDDCKSAVQHSNQAFSDFNAGDYSGGYKNAETAVQLSESCSENDLPSVKGFALSAKAFNEKHLSQGDSATDINQAIQLLSDCQSRPGYYGTHEGALCDTQEENDIKTKDNWDMAQYEN